MCGGEALADQGFSLTRTALRVTIIAEGRSCGVEVIACSMSDFSSGVPFILAGLVRRLDGLLFLSPWMTLRPDRGSNESGFRTRAVMVCSGYPC